MVRAKEQAASRPAGPLRSLQEPRMVVSITPKGGNPMMKQLYRSFLDEAIPVIRLGLRAFVIAACVVGVSAGCRMTRSNDPEASEQITWPLMAQCGETRQ